MSAVCTALPDHPTALRVRSTNGTGQCEPVYLCPKCHALWKPGVTLIGASHMTRMCRTISSVVCSPNVCV